MKTLVPATPRVASLSPKNISASLIRNICRVIILGLLLSGIEGLHAHAQFSKPVVVLKGTVCLEKTGKPFPVKISVRSYDNKALELTSSQSNSVSGSYLVVLQPKKKYWVRCESEDVTAEDELIETPAVDGSTVQINKDFIVTRVPGKAISDEKRKQLE